MMLGMTPEAMAFVVFSVGMLVLMGTGMNSHSVVLGYPVALLPLPALLCAVAIGVMALVELVRGKPLDLGHGAEVE